MMWSVLLLSGLAQAEAPESARLEVASGHTAAVECALDVGGRRVSLGRDGAILVWDRPTGRIVDRRSGPGAALMGQLRCASAGDHLAWADDGRVGFIDLANPQADSVTYSVGQDAEDWATVGESSVVSGHDQVFAWAHGAGADQLGVHRYHPTDGLTGSAATDRRVAAAAVGRRDDQVVIATDDGRLERWKVSRRGGKLLDWVALPAAEAEGEPGLPTTFAGLVGRAERLRAIGHVADRVVAVHGNGRIFEWGPDGVREVADIGEVEDVAVHRDGVAFVRSWQLGTWRPGQGVVESPTTLPMRRVAMVDDLPTGLGDNGAVVQRHADGGLRRWTGPILQPVDRLMLQPGHLAVLRPGRPLLRWALDGGPPRAHADDAVDPKSHRPKETIGLDALAGTPLVLERVGQPPKPGDRAWAQRTLRVVDLDRDEVVWSITVEHEPIRGRWRFLSDDQIGFSGEGGKRVRFDDGRIEDMPILDGFVGVHPNGDLVAVAHGHDKGTTLWDLDGDQARWTSSELNGPFRASLGWDGNDLLGFGFQGEIFRVNVDTGEAQEQWNNRQGSGLPLVASRPGSTELTMPLGGGVAMIWDPTGARQVVDEEWGVEDLVQRPLGIAAHVGLIRDLQWLDNNRLITGGEDGVVHVWRVQDRSVARLCSLYAFSDNTWAVVDPDGRYDASNAGDIDHLHWVVDGEPVALSQLKARYWHPGLLGACTGQGQAALRDVDGLGAVALHPKIAVSMEGGQLRVALDGRSGGIGPVRVRLNGKEITADLRQLGSRGDGPGEVNLQLDLGESKLLLPGRDNVVEVIAENQDGTLVSRGIQARFQVEGNRRVPRLFALVVGTSDYDGKKLDLRFAARDAVAFATAVRAGGAALFDHVDVRLLATEGQGARPPTRANVVAELERLAAQTRPEDVVLVYVAGHGVVTSGDDGELQLLLADAWTSDLSDPAVRGRVALSSTALTGALTAMPASKQVLILDTCHSGKVLESLSAARAVPGAQIRALDRMKERAGLFVIAGSAADSVSYEATRYGQGLLTYSLLAGMRGAALRDGSLWDVSGLFGYASDRVPQLARGIGGVQRPVVAMPRGGGSFDIGRATAEVRRQIPLAQDRPVVLRSNFQDEDQFADVQSVSTAVDEVLRDRSAGAAAPFVFIDGSDWQGAIQVAGRYRTASGGAMTAQVRVLRDGQSLAQWSGSADDPRALAVRVADLLEGALDD